MERMTRLRARILLGLFAFIMVLYAMRLFNLQIISTDGNTDNTTYYTTVTTVRAARGDILERQGSGWQPCLLRPGFQPFRYQIRR